MIHILEAIVIAAAGFAVLFLVVWVVCGLFVGGVVWCFSFTRWRIELWPAPVRVVFCVILLWAILRAGNG